MMRRRPTDLPTPLRPKIQTVSPRITSKLTSLRTWFDPKDLDMCANPRYGLRLSETPEAGRRGSSIKNPPAVEIKSCSFHLRPVSAEGLIAVYHITPKVTWTIQV